MSLVIDDRKDPIHIPQRRDVFEFDAEVAEIFDNMAERSIPLYHQFHSIHVRFMRKYFQYRNAPVTMLDIGASTGAFFVELCNQFHVDPTCNPPGYYGIAVDQSQPMLDKLERRVPWVTGIKFDALDIGRFDIDVQVVNMTHLSQFIHPDSRYKLFSGVGELLRSGGLFFFGTKDRVQPECESVFDEMYYKFRKDNGYTEEEIKAKTEALRNSMWPDRYEQTVHYLREAGFDIIQPTTRWLHFQSLIAIKR